MSRADVVGEIKQALEANAVPEAPTDKPITKEHDQVSYESMALLTVVRNRIGIPIPTSGSEPADSEE